MKHFVQVIRLLTGFIQYSLVSTSGDFFWMLIQMLLDQNPKINDVKIRCLSWALTICCCNCICACVCTLHAHERKGTYPKLL